MKAGRRGDLATAHWKFYSTRLLRDSSLMLNLLQCHIVFFLIERLTQPQVSAKLHANWDVGALWEGRHVCKRE